MSEKTGKYINCRSCRRDLYLEINYADLRKVFACMVTYISLCQSESGGGGAGYAQCPVIISIQAIIMCVHTHIM